MILSFLITASALTSSVGGAAEQPWEGAILAARVARLRSIVPITTADELVRACDARLVGAGTFAGPDASPAHVATARRLADLFGASTGVAFVLIPTLEGARTAGFEGAMFNRGGRVVANLAIGHHPTLAEVEAAVDRVVARSTRANDHDGLVMKMIERADIASRRTRKTRGHGRVDPGRELNVVFEKLAREARVFVEDPPRPIRIVFDCAQAYDPNDPAEVRVRAYLRLLSTREGDLRFVVLRPDRVRMYVAGHVLDESGRPAD